MYSFFAKAGYGEQKNDGREDPGDGEGALTDTNSMPDALMSSAIPVSPSIFEDHDSAWNSLNAKGKDDVATIIKSAIVNPDVGRLVTDLASALASMKSGDEEGTLDSLLKSWELRGSATIGDNPFTALLTAAARSGREASDDHVRPVPTAPSNNGNTLHK